MNGILRSYPLKDIEAWQSEGLVTWLGETADVRPFLSRADVVVLPSYREGLTTISFRSLGHGKTCYYYRHAGMPGCC